MCISEEGILFVLWGGTRSVWELVCQRAGVRLKTCGMIKTHFCSNLSF